MRVNKLVVVNPDDIFLRPCWYGGMQMRFEGELTTDDGQFGRGELTMDLSNDYGGGIRLKLNRRPNFHWNFSYDLNIREIELQKEGTSVIATFGDYNRVFAIIQILTYNFNKATEVYSMLSDIFLVMSEEIPEIDFIID